MGVVAVLYVMPWLLTFVMIMKEEDLRRQLPGLVQGVTLNILTNFGLNHLFTLKKGKNKLVAPLI